MRIELLTGLIDHNRQVRGMSLRSCSSRNGQIVRAGGSAYSRLSSI